jgi:transcriptional regulator with XRE-family HTH domain
MAEARKHVPHVIRTFMRVRGTTQEDLGAAIGLTQTQLSRRLAKSTFTYDELVGIAKVFGVHVTTFEKPIKAALSDLPDDADEPPFGSSPKGVQVSSLLVEAA